MATTKRAQYQFKVKEGIDDPYIVAEHSGREPLGDRPLKDPDFFAFDLREGISLDEAGRVADFMNDHLLSVAIVMFGDVEDIKREVKQDTNRAHHTEQTLRTVLEEIKASLRAEGVAGALEHLKGVEAWCNHLLNDWKRALKQYQWFV